jgi:replication factor C subunit 3/5
METPKKLEDLTHNKTLTTVLTKLSQYNDFPNLLFCGVSGSGKHTRIRCFLANLFGSNNVHDLKIENREYKIATRTISVTINRSFFHVEINPSAHGVYDRMVVQEIIKEIAETPSVTRFVGVNNKPKIKVVVIDQADLLTKRAQEALRVTMEIYSSHCRIILCCSNYSKIIKPLRSRCLFIRVPAPSIVELNAILGKSGKSVVALKTQNIRKAKLMMLAGIEKLEWEVFITGVAELIVKQTNVVKIREELYQLLVVGVPENIIFRTLTKDLIKLLPKKIHEIIDNSCKYQHSSIMGQKPIYHLEAFVAKVQSII